jgi:cysteine desulfurase/selenocysteine lyase
MTLDPSVIRRDFPIFDRVIRDGKKLVYLDSGATSQKPNSVIDAESNFYRSHNAAAHRGAHQLAEEATESIESAREIVAKFLGGSTEEIVFTKSSTEALNLLAYSIGSASSENRFHIKAGDEIVVTEMEHHANLIPWQQLAKRTGAVLKWFEVDQSGRLDLSNIQSVITDRTKVVAMTHQSNVLGTVIPLADLVKRAHEVGAIFILDACQSVPHMPVNVKALDIDFLVFSGHKTVGPTGVGVLWGRSNLLEALPPFLFGGSMIETVTMTDATWAPAPRKFEAGVPNMAQIVGLGAALNYLSNVGMENIHKHEVALTRYTLDKLQEIDQLRIVGPTDTHLRGSAIAFTLGEIHPHDLGQYLDSAGIAVRTGHHCAWPLTRKMGVPATTRASLYLYNDEADIDSLVAATLEAQKYFA